MARLSNITYDLLSSSKSINFLWLSCCPMTRNNSHFRDSMANICMIAYHVLLFLLNSCGSPAKSLFPSYSIMNFSWLIFSDAHTACIVANRLYILRSSLLYADWIFLTPGILNPFAKASSNLSFSNNTQASVPKLLANDPLQRFFYYPLSNLFSPIVLSIQYMS